MKAVLAIDQGTSASKAAVYDARGRRIGFARVPVKTRFGAGGEATQDPEEIAASASRAVRRALSAAGWPRVESVGIASQRSTFVLWDRATGRAVAPAPTWQSTAALDLCERLVRHAPRIARRTGLPLSPHYSASKLARLIHARDALRRDARRGRILFGPVATFVLWRLTGGAVHAVDPTLAGRTLMLGLRSLAWDPWLQSLFGVPEGILPEVRSSLGFFGTARIEGRDVPVRAMLGDQQAALIGAVGLHEAGRPGTALVNYGTGAFVLAPTGTRLRRHAGLLSALAWTDGRSRRHLVEGTVNAGGTSLDWLREEFGAPAGLDGIDRLCRRARSEVTVLPAFRGLGSAHMGAADRRLGAMVAAGAGSVPWSLADLVRGAVESIAHAVRECLDLARESLPAATGLRRVIATGPLTHLSWLTGFQAALLDRPLEIARSEEATLAGAACAASGGDLFPSGSPTRRVRSPGERMKRDAARRHAAWLNLIEAGRRWGAHEAGG